MNTFTHQTELTNYYSLQWYQNTCTCMYYYAYYALSTILTIYTWLLCFLVSLVCFSCLNLSLAEYSYSPLPTFTYMNDDF